MNQDINCNKNVSDSDSEKKLEEPPLSGYIKCENADEDQLELSTKLIFTARNAAEFYVKNEDFEIKSEDADMSYSSKRRSRNSGSGLVNMGQVHCLGADQFIINEDINCDKTGLFIEHLDIKEEQDVPVMIKWENAGGDPLELPPKHNFMETSPSEVFIKNEEIEIKSEDADQKIDYEEIVDKPTKRIMLCCQFCTFKARSEKIFDRHLLIHKSLTDVTIFRCNNCSFVTKNKGRLRVHMTKIHIYPSEPKQYKCKFCPYTNKYSFHLKQHELAHKHPSERAKFKCSVCQFQCYSKHYFKQHFNGHIVDSKKLWTSSSRSTYGELFKVHVPCHRRETEVFCCAHCSHKTKRKADLKNHLMTHSTNPDVYKCEICRYETTQNQYLRRHMLRHIENSKISLYKCDECTFETKYKHSLRGHKKYVHDRSQRKMYKCDLCPVQCMSQHGLKSHLLSHKHIDEIPVYKCFHCSSQTNNKLSFIRHLKTHSNESRKPS